MNREMDIKHVQVRQRNGRL